ncbi:MAG: hypothetical protein KAV42_04175 [Candidatus Krumholzibacteria bacterium]|nr:hypothetical protein [Candidatus Krumholzibacteria bacterium]
MVTRRIKRRKKRQTPVLLRISLTAFLIMLALYVPLKYYIASTEPRDPVPDGTSLKIFVTNELNCYREPCG